MKSFNMNKLVRDKILEKMTGQGKNVKSRILEEKEFVEQLKIKLKEELNELNEVDYGDKEHFINELADIQSLIDYLLKVNNISKEEIDSFQKDKLLKAGGFDKRIYVERVDLSDDDEWVEYYRNKGFEEIK